MKAFRSLLIPALLIAGGCKRAAESAADPSAPSVTVQVATVTSSSFTPTQTVAGTVRPFARATIAAKVTGTVATTQLVVGRTVTAGEVLVTLQASELTARAEQAQAALAQSERELERERSLETQGAAPTESVRAAEDRHRQARAAAEEAQALLSYTRVAAPFAGVITSELVKPGDLAMPGRSLFEIEGLDRLRAEVQVPESLLSPAIGSPVDVIVGETTVAGTLAELSPAADPASRTRLGKIDLPASAVVRSGQFVRVLWPAANDTSLTVPTSAVSVLGQMERVFVVDHGRVQMRLIKTGAQAGGRTQVMSGLNAGESVVVTPAATLRDGQPVEIKP